MWYWECSASDISKYLDLYIRKDLLKMNIGGKSGFVDSSMGEILVGNFQDLLNWIEL